jgi:diguanylate cyclase
MTETPPENDVDTRGEIAAASIAHNWLSEYKGHSDRPIALLLAGIRDLKQINERHGRQQGDAVIRAAGAQILSFCRDNLPNTQMIARMPGREFMIILNGAETNKVLETCAYDLLEALSSDLASGDEPVHISARIGIVQSEPGESGTELLHRAGAALAKAYARKGKRLAFADYHRATGAEVTAAIDSGVRAAIIEREIAIVLQPQFEVATGRLVGAEALARMQHKELGEIGADQLFAAADRTDLREELSLLIQEQAIAIAAAWPPALDNLRLAVNLGAQELDEGYSGRLLGLLERTGFNAGRLTLELTEESLVRDLDLAAGQLEQLRTHAIRIAVDDFGTGYSSLAYLKALPLDYLKIDKSMTPDINGTAKDRIVLRAIIAMGKALGLRIIAEGVEREEELEMLKAEECDYFQGYLRSQPLSPSAFEHFALLSN